MITHTGRHQKKSYTTTTNGGFDHDQIDYLLVVYFNVKNYMIYIYYIYTVVYDWVHLSAPRFEPHVQVQKELNLHLI